jgi:hypothetical protein
MHLSLKKIFDFKNTTVASQSRWNLQFTFRNDLKTQYNQLDDGNLFNIATGLCLLYTIIVAVHIFQYRWQDSLSQFTTLTNINNIHNGLLLYKPVEWAFDQAKLYIEVNSKKDMEMTFHLLNQDLYDIQLTDKSCEIQCNHGYGNGHLEAEYNLEMTFGNLNGQLLKFSMSVTMWPSKQLLGLHANAAQLTAQNRTSNTKLDL